MTNYTKEVSEQIGAREADTDIIVSKTSIWETPSSALLIQISACDVTTDWSSNYGSLSIDTADKKEGTGSLKDTVAAPSPPTEYVTQYNPTGSWDWFAKKHILFWLKCDRANTAFTWADFAIYDTLGNYRYWDLSFSAGIWTAIKKLLSTGDGQSGTPPNLALIERIRMGFKAADTTPFYRKIDDVRVITPTIWADNKIIQEQENE